MNYGIALGSGGIRGMAHIALLEYLEKKYNNKPLVITGCSAGSIIGALYSLEPNSTLIMKKLNYIINHSSKEINHIRKNLENKVTGFARLLASTGILNNDILFNLLKSLFHKKRFSDCKIPFGVVAVDIDSESIEEITEGYILDAVMASSNVPAAFTPKLLGGMRLIDGGVIEEVPINLCRKLGAEYVIASHIPQKSNSFSDGLEYINFISSLSVDYITNNHLKEANEVYIFDSIYQWYDFNKFKDIYFEAKKKLERSEKNAYN
ncbi:NTE family protein [Marinitoga hydrogenitolerans DSM 16785]|uniref:NTE family protein n=1 Tax=Marinitoga hydrogenitolerans (strain DSM 16785 / JCM 12826 / AT1271) TaxID=1122195 RepID=A0A1M4WA60_MARH1|nr:patatin-like phospholipase family protein [Marinitoga hydrogenitolerans]SHE78124.1 NTE family protein [Marinitoga hydrogenitolerans DSM 16785]